MEEADLEMEIAKALLKDIRLMVSKEVDAKLDSFLKREEEELKALFAKVKEEESERIKLMLEGIKKHTIRIKFLEQNVVWEDNSDEEM
jgi:rRNA-processing protein FCF1